jgi:hypothetical protein
MMSEEKVTESGIVYFEYPVEDRILKMFVSNSPSRLEEETHEEYKTRRKINRGSMKRFKRGRMLWNPYILGNSKGLQHNERNRETVTAFIEQMKKQQEENNEQEDVEE